MFTDNRHARYLSSVLETYNLHLASVQPTHHVIYEDGSVHESCLDLVITSDPDLILNHHISDSLFAAGHHYIKFNYQILMPRMPTITREIRKISRVNSTTFNTHLEDLLLSTEFSRLSRISDFSLQRSPGRNGETVTEICPNDLVSAITVSLNTALDAAAPLTSVIFKDRAKPWVTQEIRNLIRSRDRAFKAYKRRRTAPRKKCQYDYHGPILAQYWPSVLVFFSSWSSTGWILE
uniref:Uncharacterized protein n=1 Tax=Trichogramma kaykai TaxID=54128 RepID=A0ABD2W0L1_9HYME